MNEEQIQKEEEAEKIFDYQEMRKLMLKEDTEKARELTEKQRKWRKKIIWIVVIVFLLLAAAVVLLSS